MVMVLMIEDYLPKLLNDVKFVGELCEFVNVTNELCAALQHLILSLLQCTKVKTICRQR